ncbi:MAG: Vitamin B12 transporter BtuB [bacterium]|nr:Vitamin B12 transporter BtuB [bacterium]
MNIKHGKYLVLAMLCSLTTAFSQNAVNQQSTVGDTAIYQLQQITVTALRYPEQIVKVPLAISVIGPEQLQNTRGYGMEEALKFVPGVLAQSRAGNQDLRITIRGFGARGAGDRSNAGTSRGIRILLDGAPETEPDGRTAFDLIDLSLAQRIEVIRSNASAVWGNASGGVINIISAPDFETPYLSPQALNGSFGLQKYTLQTGARVGEARLALALTNTNFEGWRRNSTSERTLVNISMLSNPGERTKLGVYLIGAKNKFLIPGPLSQAQFDADPQQANATYLSRNERRYNRLGRFSATLDHDLNDTHGFSALAFAEPKYLQRSERGTFRDFNRYHVGGNVAYRFRQNLSPAVKSIFQVGVDEAYQDGAILFYSLSPTNGRGSTLQQNKREGANTLGAFVQEELSFGQSWSVLLGARYSDVKYHTQDFINTALNSEKSFAKWTPKIGVNFRLSPAHSFYANLGGGIEVPAGNETDPASTFGQDQVYAINPLLDPIQSTTVEIGTKHVLVAPAAKFLRSFSYEVAAYGINIKDDIIPYRGGRFYFTAGKTRRYGLELGTNGHFDYGLSLQAALSYARSKYVDYQVDSVHYGRAGRFADYKDNKVAGVPEVFYNFALRFEPPKLRSAYIEINLQGVGEYFVDDANLTKVPSYSLLNLTAGFHKPVPLTEGLGLRAFFAINNLSDKKYAGSAFVNPDVVNGAPLFLEPGLPRNYVIGISFVGSKTP